MSVALNGRIRKLEVWSASLAKPQEAHWLDRVPEAVMAYLLAQDETVHAAFLAHVRGMQDLPGNKHGFDYYQVLTRPWRPGARRFLAPALMVWDAVFLDCGRVSLGEAQLRVLDCGYHNLLDATPEAVVPPAARGPERDAPYLARRAAVWARLAGGKLCGQRDCVCFCDRWHRCRDTLAVVAAWRARGTADPATLAAMGFGEPELALLAIDDEADEVEVAHAA